MAGWLPRGWMRRSCTVSWATENSVSSLDSTCGIGSGGVANAREGASKAALHSHRRLHLLRAAPRQDDWFKATALDTFCRAASWRLGARDFVGA